MLLQAPELSHIELYDASQPGAGVPTANADSRNACACDGNTVMNPVHAARGTDPGQQTLPIAYPAYPTQVQCVTNQTVPGTYPLQQHTVVATAPTVAACAVAVPVVSSPIINIGSLSSTLALAFGAGLFVRSIVVASLIGKLAS